MSIVQQQPVNHAMLSSQSLPWHTTYIWKKIAQEFGSLECKTLQPNVHTQFSQKTVKKI